MLDLVAQLVPLAIGIAASPVPVLATILMLLSPRATSGGVAFILGWLSGIVAAVLLFTALTVLTQLGDSAVINSIAATTQLLIAAALIVLAIIQWRRRGRGQTEPVLPNWLRVLDDMPVAHVFAIGLALAAINPKNLLLALAAGRVVGDTMGGVLESAAALAIYVLIGGSIVVVLVIVRLVAPTRSQRLLVALRAWLVRNSAVVAVVVLLLLAALMVWNAVSTVR